MPTLAGMIEERASRRLLAALGVLSLGLLCWVMSPFWAALFLAAVGAGALRPWFRWLTRRLRGRQKVAAAILTLGMVLLVVLPLSAMVTVVIRQGIDTSRMVTETLREKGVQGLVEPLPQPLERLANRLLTAFPGVEERLEGRSPEPAPGQSPEAGRTAVAAASAVGGLLSATGSAIFQLLMFLIALFFLLLDGPRLVDWLVACSPLPRRQSRELLEDFRRTAVSVISSTTATAGVQTVAALIGYLIARVPHPLFFAAVTFFLAFIPAIGAGGACLAAAAVLLLSGELGWAIFLAVWGIVVVGLADNVVKPLLMRHGAQLNGAVIFFALLGGLAVFGPVGLILGPLVVVFFVAVMRMYAREERGPVLREGPPGPTVAGPAAAAELAQAERPGASS